MLLRADHEVALVEQELLGLVGEDRERLAGVDDLDRRRPGPRGPPGPAGPRRRSRRASRAPSTWTARRPANASAPERVLARRDLDRAGPVRGRRNRIPPEERARSTQPRSRSFRPDRRRARRPRRPCRTGAGGCYWYSRHLCPHLVHSKIRVSGSSAPRVCRRTQYASGLPHFGHSSAAVGRVARLLLDDGHLAAGRRPTCRPRGRCPSGTFVPQARAPPDPGGLVRAHQPLALRAEHFEPESRGMRI